MFIQVFFSILVAIILTFSALYLRTFVSTPDVSPELMADGNFITLPNDGRIVEYFEYGAPRSEAKQWTVYFHGYTLSGSAASSWHEDALQRRVRIISVSMAGWGASTPHRGRSYFDAGRDALAVVDQIAQEMTTRSSGDRRSNIIGPVNFHIVGTSFGAGNAAALAALASHRVRSLNLLIPAMPSKSDGELRHDMWQGAAFSHWLTGQPLFDRIWQYYIAPKLDIPTLLKSLAPKDWAEFEAAQGADVVIGMTRELQRSTRYHHEGACDGMRLLRGRDDPAYYDIITQPLRRLGRRLAVWYAKQDSLAPAHHGEFLARLLPSARVFARDGGHLGMFATLTPFFDEMLSNAEPESGEL